MLDTKNMRNGKNQNSQQLDEWMQSYQSTYYSYAVSAKMLAGAVQATADIAAHKNNIPWNENPDMVYVIRGKFEVSTKVSDLAEEDTFILGSTKALRQIANIPGMHFIAFKEMTSEQMAFFGVPATFVLGGAKPNNVIRSVRGAQIVLEWVQNGTDLDESLFAQEGLEKQSLLEVAVMKPRKVRKKLNMPKQQDEDVEPRGHVLRQRVQRVKIPGETERKEKWLKMVEEQKAEEEAAESKENQEKTSETQESASGTMRVHRGKKLIETPDHVSMQQNPANLKEDEPKPSFLAELKSKLFTFKKKHPILSLAILIGAIIVISAAIAAAIVFSGGLVVAGSIGSQLLAMLFLTAGLSFVQGTLLAAGVALKNIFHKPVKDEPTGGSTVKMTKIIRQNAPVENNGIGEPTLVAINGVKLTTDEYKTGSVNRLGQFSGTETTERVTAAYHEVMSTRRRM